MARECTTAPWKQDPRTFGSGAVRLAVQDAGFLLLELGLG
jgi:hypothetical protein